jgi:large subunit ribosomal protein L15
MPPRLNLVSSSCIRGTSSLSPLAAFLVPFLHQQNRSASILASLSDNTSAYNKKIRRGRGPSSGKGKTSGRGHKGQKQHGKVPRGFQGGQTPQEIVQGLRGFENQYVQLDSTYLGFVLTFLLRFSLNMSTINLDTIQSWIDQGRLDPTKPITLKELVESRCLHGIKDGVKLLGRVRRILQRLRNVY